MDPHSHNVRGVSQGDSSVPLQGETVHIVHATHAAIYNSDDCRCCQMANSQKPLLVTAGEKERGEGRED